jgi:hypothetical protein
MLQLVRIRRWRQRLPTWARRLAHHADRQREFRDGSVALPDHDTPDVAFVYEVLDALQQFAAFNLDRLPPGAFVCHVPPPYLIRTRDAFPMFNGWDLAHQRADSTSGTHPARSAWLAEAIVLRGDPHDNA